MIRVLRFFRMTDEDAICEKLNILIDNIDPEDKVKAKIFKFILIGFSCAYFLACAWYIYITSFWSDYDFEERYFQDTSMFKKVILSYYFILSTLATVGYGDLVPLTTQDRIIGIIIMICGVGFFSYIINNFNNIMKNYRTKLGYFDKIPELEDWLLSLNKVSEKSIDKELVKNIYSYFNYYYKNYRLVTLTKDDKYFKLMTDNERILMIRHIFQDIFNGTFRTFFLKGGGGCEFQDFNFYIDIAFAIQPRKCLEKEIILQQGENVQEMYFLVDGEIEVSFMVDKLKIQKYFSKGFQFGCVQILSGSVSNFTYKVTSPSTLYVIKKDAFLKIYNKYTEVRQDIILNAFAAYKITRRDMMEAFAQQVKNSINIKLSVKESNQVFDYVNNKLQSSKNAIILNTISVFSKRLNVNYKEQSPVSTSSNLSFQGRIDKIKRNVNQIDDLISEIQQNKDDDYLPDNNFGRQISQKN